MSNFNISQILFCQNNNMDLKVAAKCIIEQDTGIVVVEAGNKLPARAVILCKNDSILIYLRGGRCTT